MTAFVEMYHPLLADTITSPKKVAQQAVDNYAARGWLLVDGGALPDPSTPYYTKEALLSQIQGGAAPIGTALRAAFAPLVGGKVPSANLPGFVARYSDLSPPIVIAHQGGANLGPYNTMEAYRAALGFGSQVLDGDVNLLADGALGVMHNSTIDADTTGTGPVADQTSASWQNLVVDAGTWFAPSWGNLKPTLASRFLAEFGGRVVVSLEAKTAGAAAVALAREIERYGVEESIIASTSFWADIPTLVATGAHVQYVMATGVEKTPAEVAAAGVASIACDRLAAGFTSSLVTAFHAVGVDVFSYTVNRQIDAATELAKGVDGWYSDDPLYSNGAANGYAYRLPKMPFNTQTYYHGHLQGAAGLRGVWTAPDGWGFADTTNAGARTVLAGGISPIKGNPAADTFTLDLTVTIASQFDTGRFFAIFVGMADDRAYSDNGAATGINGYRCLLSGAGTLQVVKYTNGVAASTLASVASTALSLPATIPMRLTVTPTQLTWQRLDASPASTGALTDSSYRGGYVHMEMSGTTGRFTRLEVTA